MIATSIVGFSDAHGVVGKVNIAVIAWIVSGRFSERLGFAGGSYRRVL